MIRPLIRLFYPWTSHHSVVFAALLVLLTLLSVSKQSAQQRVPVSRRVVAKEVVRQLTAPAAAPAASAGIKDVEVREVRYATDASGILVKFRCYWSDGRRSDEELILMDDKFGRFSGEFAGRAVRVE